MRYSVALVMSIISVTGCKSTSQGGTSADLASADSPYSSGNTTTAALKIHDAKIEKMLPQMRYEFFQIANSQSDIAIGVSAGHECDKLRNKESATQEAYANRLGFKACEISTVVTPKSGQCAVSCTQPIVEKSNVRYLTFLEGVDYFEAMVDGYPGCRSAVDRFMGKTIDGRSFGEPLYGVEFFKGIGGSTTTRNGCRIAVSLR